MIILNDEQLEYVAGGFTVQVGEISLGNAVSAIVITSDGMVHIFQDVSNDPLTEFETNHATLFNQLNEHLSNLLAALTKLDSEEKNGIIHFRFN